MKNILMGVLAIIGGIVVGGFVNMAIVMISHSVVPLPEGVDPNNMESIKAAMPSYEMKHFLMPFLAHALGSMVGGLVAALTAVKGKMSSAIAIGAFFFLGGAYMVTQLPSPMWFNVLDLVGAYIPMGYLGFVFASKLTTKS